MQGRLSPNNHGAPHSHDSPLFRHASPPPTPPPQTIFGHFIRNYVRVFCELWKLAVRDNDTKKEKNIYMGLVKHCVYKLRIKRNRASVASEKIF